MNLQFIQKNTVDSILIKIMVIPNSSVNKIVGIYNNQWLKIKITAAAINFAANLAIIDFISKLTGVKVKNIYIMHGLNSKYKTIVLADLKGNVEIIIRRVLDGCECK